MKEVFFWPIWENVDLTCLSQGDLCLFHSLWQSKKSRVRQGSKNWELDWSFPVHSELFKSELEVFEGGRRAWFRTQEHFQIPLWRNLPPVEIKQIQLQFLFTNPNHERSPSLYRPVKNTKSLLWLGVISKTNVAFHDKIPVQGLLRKQSSLFIFHKTVYVYFLGTHSCGYTFILQEGEGRPLAIYLRMNYHCDWQYCSIFWQKKVDVLSAWKKSLICCGKIFRLEMW